METDKPGSELLRKAVDEWQQEGKLSAEKADELRGSIAIKQNDRQQIAQYFFFIALFCTLLAFGAIFLNEKLLEQIKAYFSWSDLVITMITAMLSAFWLWYISKKRNHISAIAFEIDMVLGGLAVLTSMLYFCKYFHIDKTYTAFLSISLVVLALLSILLRSKALWIGTILTAVGWFGSWSTWLSADDLFLGMNYPVRYTLFGAFILAIALAQRKSKLFSFAERITYVAGLAILFCGFWGMSVFGNYSSLEEWQQVRQIHVLAYSVVFGIAAALSFYLGFRYRDELARDFGVLFLLINLYTRYFEYFWDTMNKGIFFLILAITFGFVGWWLERRSRIARSK